MYQNRPFRCVAQYPYISNGATSLQTIAATRSDLPNLDQQYLAPSREPKRYFIVKIIYIIIIYIIIYNIIIFSLKIIDLIGFQFTDSNRATPSAPIFPDGVKPRPPINPAPRSDKISPYKLGITRRSNWPGS